MESEPAGDYIGLVVRLQTAADGTWQVAVDGTAATKTFPLRPLTLIMRLWRISETGLLRGTLRLQDGDIVAPIQSNAQLEALVRSWLVGADNAATE